jgi:hypothetical protein
MERFLNAVIPFAFAAVVLMCAVYGMPRWLYYRHGMIAVFVLIVFGTCIAAPTRNWPIDLLIGAIAATVIIDLGPPLIRRFAAWERRDRRRQRRIIDDFDDFDDNDEHPL